MEEKNESKIKKIAVFSHCFIPDEKFEEYFKSLGYIRFMIDKYEMMHDPRIIEYVENNYTIILGRNVIKGKKDIRYRVGFAGLGCILEVDTSKTWTIEFDSMDLPYIRYCKVNIDKYGELTIINDRD